MKVRLREILKAIKQFNREGKNPYKIEEKKPWYNQEETFNAEELNVEIEKAKVWFELRTGEEKMKEGEYWVYPSIWFPFSKNRRSEKVEKYIKETSFSTEREFLYPITKKKGRPRRIYKFNAATKKVEEVRLLSSRRMDPEFTGKSGFAWLKEEEKKGIISPNLVALSFE